MRLVKKRDSAGKKKCVTYEEADRVAGKRLDRRRNYCIIEGEVHESVTRFYECELCGGRGCHECGWHGTVKQTSWVPIC